MDKIASSVLLLPPFPEGQVINDFLARLRSKKTDFRLEDACLELLGRRPGLDSMPNGLRAFHETIGHFYGTLHTIGVQHTAVEYYCCGQPLNRFETQWNRLLEIHPGPVRLVRLPIMFQVSEREYLQCPECVEEQVREFGFSFIHRRTGAPFVNMCCAHESELRAADGQGLLFDARCRNASTALQRRMAVEFARRVSDSMERSASECVYHKDRVREAIDAAGWVRENSRIKISELIGAFSQYFLKAFGDARLDHLTQMPEFVEQAIRNLFRTDRAVHPTWCVLFAWFAENCRSRSLAAPPTRRARPQARVLAADELSALMERWGTITATAKAVSMSINSISTLCKRHRIEASWRPKLDEAITDGIVAALKQRLPLMEIQRRYRVSQSTVYRIAAACPDYVAAGRRKICARTEASKSQWLAIQAANPGVSDTRLRRNFPALWSRLRRNEPSWLREHQSFAKHPRPKHRRPSPPLLLDLFNDALTGAELSCDGETSVPQRKSLYRLRKLTGVSAYTCETLSLRVRTPRYTEPRREFVHRRVAWAKTRLASGRNSVWKIARVAGLRVETILAHTLTTGTTNDSGPTE